MSAPYYERHNSFFKFHRKDPLKRVFPTVDPERLSALMHETDYVLAKKRITHLNSVVYDAGESRHELHDWLGDHYSLAVDTRNTALLKLGYTTTDIAAATCVDAGTIRLPIRPFHTAIVFARGKIQGGKKRKA
jgi:hypothetical protein